MLICLADSTPALQSRSNLDSVVSFALVCSCSFGVVVSFFIQIHISFHKNIPFFKCLSAHSLVLGQEKEAIVLSTAQIFTFWFLSIARKKHHIPLSSIPPELWIVDSFFPKVLWVFFVEMKPLFSLTGKKQCY